MRRKVLLSVISAVCVVLCAFALVGCGQKEMDVKGNAFVFKDISFTYSDNFPADEKITAEELEWYKTEFKDKLLTFTEDGKFEMQYGATLSGTYVQDDAKVTLTVTQDGKTETIDATVSGNDVTVKMWSEFKLDDNSTAKAYINIVYTKTTVSSGSEGGSGEGTPTPASTQVTEAQWKTAMTSVRNYSGSTTTEYQGQPLTISLKCAGETLSQERGTQAVIITKDGDNYYAYYTENGTAWTRRILTQQSYQGMSAQVLLFGFFENDYSSFTYADGKYTATANLDKTATMNGIITSMEVVFSNGQITSMSFTATSEGENYSYSFSDFGTTTITIPTDYTEASSSTPEENPTDPVTPETRSEVTEEEWVVAMNTTTNYTANLTVTYGEQTSSTTILFDGNSCLMADIQSVNIITKDGDNYYCYYAGSEDWERVAIEQEDYEDDYKDILFFTFFENDFASFTYADGKYTSTEELDKTVQIGGVVVYIEVVFSNGQITSMLFMVRMNDEILSFAFSNIGTTTVDIPTSYKEVVQG